MAHSLVMSETMLFEVFEMDIEKACAKFRKAELRAIKRCRAARDQFRQALRAELEEFNTNPESARIAQLHTWTVKAQDEYERAKTSMQKADRAHAKARKQTFEKLKDAVLAELADARP